MDERSFEEKRFATTVNQIVVPKSSKYLVIVEEGVFRNAWRNHLMVRKGVMSIAGEDVVQSKRAGRASLINDDLLELAFRMNAIMEPNGVKLLFWKPEVDAELLKGVFEKAGFHVVVTDPTGRFALREADNFGVRVPRKELAAQRMLSLRYERVADFIINERHELTKWVTRRSYLASHPGVVVPANDLVEIDDENSKSVQRSFGKWIRNKVMMRVNMMGLRYVGLGDELETVDLALRTKTLSTHYGDTKGIVYPQMMPKFEGLPSTHDGQAKLLVADRSFLARFSGVRVLLLGGSPGEHWDELLWMVESIVNYDPRPMAVDSPKVTHVSDVVTTDNIDQIILQQHQPFVIINDIRRDPDPDEDTADAWEQSVEEDFHLGMKILTSAMTNQYFLGYSFKMRLPHGRAARYTIPGGAQIFAQPFAKPGTTETRAFWDAKCIGRSEDIVVKEYERWTRSISIGRTIEMDDWLEGNMLKYAIRNEDIMSIRTGSSELAVGLFSISNVRNDGKLNDRWLKQHKNLFFIAPVLEVARQWPDGYYGISYTSKTIISNVGKERFSDMTLSSLEQPFDWGASFWTINDACAWFDYTDYPSPDSQLVEMPDKHWDRAHPFNSLWGAWFYGTIGPETRFQTWINSQTQWTRVISVTIRHVYGLDDAYLHAARRKALLKVFPDAVVFDHPAVTGYIRQGSRKYFISVSGHLLNLVLSCITMGNVDVNRYLKTVEYNVRAYSKKLTKQEFETFLCLKRRSLLAEDAFLTDKILWHSWYDWHVALSAYDVLAKDLGLPWMNVRKAAMQSRINKLKAKYPKFLEMGKDAEVFAKSKEATSVPTVSEVVEGIS